MQRALSENLLPPTMNDSILSTMQGGDEGSKHCVFDMLPNGLIKSAVTEEMRQRVAAQNMRARRLAMLQMPSKLQEGGNPSEPRTSQGFSMWGSHTIQGVVPSSTLGFVQRTLCVRPTTQVLPYAKTQGIRERGIEMQNGSVQNPAFIQRLLYNSPTQQ